MSDVGLFILGVLITIPAAAGIIGLLYAAVLDGRDNDRVTEQLKQDDTSSR
jgi:hypothetical protein